MPRYNLNQDDISLIVTALNQAADREWDPKDQSRVKRLISRLEGKINALNQNVNTQPVDLNKETNNECSVVYDDPVWNHYQRKTS